jgi:NAD kinase
VSAFSSHSVSSRRASTSTRPRVRTNSKRWVARDHDPSSPSLSLASSSSSDNVSENAVENDNSDGNSDNDNDSDNDSNPQQKGKKRKMDLMWCSKDYCKDAARERVVGDHNQILLDGPATGQVAYYWRTPMNDVNESNNNKSMHQVNKSRAPETVIAAPSVLLLVRPGDDELMRVAADAVRQLTEGESQVEILLDPSTAARLKHYHGVESEQIHLFESTPTPGFGNNLRPTDTVNMNNGAPAWASSPEPVDVTQKLQQSPDLICTLGGDGLLMHAGMLFQGPAPPILCVSGGSLGFLTPFHREEMVEAIRLALGLVQNSAGEGATDFFTDIDVFPPNMPTYPYEPLPLPPQRQPQPPALAVEKKSVPRFSFGIGGRICLSIRMRLDCRIINRDGAVRARYNVLNEVVIDRGSSPYLANLECFCDDVHLTTVQADGVIFATPTGSTAYSMAAGGSVVHPAVPCILVTPICPHVLSFRSMVFPDHVVLDVYIPDDARAEAMIAFDGKHRTELRRGDSVRIQMSAYPVRTCSLSTS